MVEVGIGAGVERAERVVRDHLGPRGPHAGDVRRIDLIAAHPVIDHVHADAGGGPPGQSLRELPADRAFGVNERFQRNRPSSRPNLAEHGGEDLIAVDECRAGIAPTSGGPRRSPIVRPNCGSVTLYRCRIGRVAARSEHSRPGIRPPEKRQAGTTANGPTVRGGVVSPVRFCFACRSPTRARPGKRPVPRGRNSARHRARIRPSFGVADPCHRFRLRYIFHLASLRRGESYDKRSRTHARARPAAIDLGNVRYSRGSRLSDAGRTG